MYSSATQDATLIAVTRSARGPKIHTEAASAGTSAIITSRISPFEVADDFICGEAVTVGFIF